MSAVEGLVGGFIEPPSPGMALAGAGGENVVVPGVIAGDAGVSILFSESLPDGVFGEKKKKEEKEGVYVKNGNKLNAKSKLSQGKITDMAAKKLGFSRTNYKSHGQPVYKKGNRYITPDVDGHNGGVWKMADSIKNLGSRSTRMGTYDAKLNRIGDWWKNSINFKHELEKLILE